MVVIIDYGLGNLRSVQKAFERINISAHITSDINEILAAQKLVLPGVGHFQKGISNLKNRGLFDCLNEAILVKKTFILGICLGMQLMTIHSEEGNTEGFGWIKADTKRFIINDIGLKIPHMGWSNLEIKNQGQLLRGLTKSDYFYFVHSYFVHCRERSEILADTEYGNRFVSMFNKENIYGCQFHPEKSHDSGLRLLKNFAEL